MYIRVDQLRYKRMHKVKDERELWSLIFFNVIKNFSVILTWLKLDLRSFDRSYDNKNMRAKTTESTIWAAEQQILM